MREKRKDGSHYYGFLLDRDVAKAASLFPKKRTKTLADVKLSERATDAEIVKMAWLLELTIVTGNGDDFVREIKAFQRRTERKNCHELHGLVVLPNGYEHQERLLEGLEEKLKLGSDRLTWKDVSQKNCFVRVKKSGKPEVKRFERCLYCQKQEVA